MNGLSDKLARHLDGIRFGVLLFLVCTAAALVATWSLVMHPSSTIPLGTENELTVPVFNLWTLWWNADCARRAFSGYWDAPFFYPTPGVQSFSEPQLLTGLLVAPLWATSATPALIYNLALLILLVLNGVFTCRLTRVLGASRLPATLAAVMAITLPFVGKHLGVLPLVPLFGLAWTLEGLVSFHRHGSLRHALWAGVGFAALLLTSQQLALLFVPFALAAALLALNGQGFRLRPSLCLAAAAMEVWVVIVLVVMPGRETRARYGFERSESVVRALSASPRDYLFRPAGATLPIPPPARPALGDTAGLFPGTLLLALAAFGAWRDLRSRQRRSWAVFLVTSLAAAFLLSLGLNLALGTWRPFATLREWLPELGQLRSPYRFAAIVHALLPPLAALGLGALHRGGRPLRGGLIVALGALVAAENLCVPVPLQAIPATPRSGWTEWLRHQPEGTVVVHVPFPTGLHVSDYALEAQRMFAQIDHRKPIVNGYSGFFSPYYTRLQSEMTREFPSQRMLCVLDCVFAANTLVLERPWQTAHWLQLDELAGMLEPLYEDREVAIYGLLPAACDCSSLD